MKRPVATPKQKHVPRVVVDLSERDAVVLYGTLTGTSKGFAERLVEEAKELFNLNIRIMALEDYE